MEWRNGDTALLELDDPRTLNAMTDALLQMLAEKLSTVLASRTVRALILQAAGPHFCPGGRYEKNSLTHTKPSWWLQTRGICGGGHVLD